MVNGERIRQARELCKFTQTDLAERAGVKQPTIARCENGVDKPSDWLMEAIARETGFPVDFFHQPDGPEFPLGSLIFRAHASTTLREKTEAYRYAQVVYEIADILAARMKPITLRLPQLNEPPAIAANITRAQLGLSPDNPIQNLMRVIETAGVLVLALPVNLDGRDAFSLWAGAEPKRRPVIFLSANRPGDRQRWTASHELGHLVLHPAIKGQIADVERQADEFAAEFLMPETAMRREIVPPVTLTEISRLKPRWRVSIAALVRRSYELGIITERQYKYLFEQIGAKGWRTQEPTQLDLPIEKPRALRKMAELVYGNPVKWQRMATELHLAPHFLKAILEAHAERPEFVSAAPVRRGNVLPLRRILRPAR